VPGVYSYSIQAWKGTDVYYYYYPSEENDGPLVNGQLETSTIVLVSLFTVLGGATAASLIFIAGSKNKIIALVALAIGIVTALTPLLLLSSDQITSHEKRAGSLAAGIISFYIFTVLLITLLLRQWQKGTAMIKFDKMHFKLIDILLSLIGYILGITGFNSEIVGYMLLTDIILTLFIGYLTVFFPYISMITVAALFGQKGQPAQRRPPTKSTSKGFYIVFVFSYLLFALIYLALFANQCKTM
jgi:hypothetical protein